MNKIIFLLVFATICRQEIFASDNETDLWIKAETNKTVVYEQESVLLSYKVYSHVDIIQLSADFPDLKGFLIAETDQNDKGKYIKERKDGKEYRTTIWNQYILYPQTTGRLEIPSISFSGTVIKEKHSNDPIQDFFDGNDGFEEASVTYTSSSTNIEVKSLPEKPSDFSGGVGTFSITATTDKENVNEGVPFTIHIIVSGVGNFKSITPPSINLTTDFEKYDTKVRDSLTITGHGYEGSQIYDIVTVPLSEGTYTIPSVKFTYFDLSDESYKTIQTDPLKLAVKKATNNKKAFDAEDKELSDNKNDDSTISYWYVVSAMLVLATLIIFFTRRYNKKRKIKELTRINDEMALSLAKNRLKKAKQMILENKRDEFYDEILRTLWEYLSKKMKISSMDMSSEKIKEKLADKAVDDQTINLLISAIEECEYERFAPGDTIGNMRKTFDSTYSAIMEIEEITMSSGNFSPA